MTSVLRQLLLVSLAACSQAAPTASKDAVLATVDGETITEADLATAAIDAVGARFAGSLDAAGRRKILESLVLSRAIAKRTGAKLSAAESADLDRRVRLYRERLLVEHFLAQKTPGERITPEMVQGYYDANPSRFGSGTARRYEILLGTRQLEEAEQKSVLAAFGQAAAQPSWRDFGAKLVAQKLPVAFRESTGVTAGLPERLMAVLPQLSVGKSSDVLMIDGRPWVARLVEERPIPPRPLSEVASEIETLLTAKRRAEMLTEVSEEVLGAADVKYRDAN
jgi:hypothetical protein